MKECPTVPPVLLKETPMPEYPTNGDWGDFAEYTVELKTAVSACNLDKETIFDWDARNTEKVDK